MANSYFEVENTVENTVLGEGEKLSLFSMTGMSYICGESPHGA